MNSPDILSDGTKIWKLDGKIHRTDGPAVEYSDGSNEWWLNGQFHRIGGPAIELENGTKEWYLNGKKYTKTEYNFWVARLDNYPER